MITLVVAVTTVAGAWVGTIGFDNVSFDTRADCLEYLKTPQWQTALKEINGYMQMRYHQPLSYGAKCVGGDEKDA